jgi:hypothetical protein
MRLTIARNFARESFVEDITVAVDLPNVLPQDPQILLPDPLAFVRSEPQKGQAFPSIRKTPSEAKAAIGGRSIAR